MIATFSRTVQWLCFFLQVHSCYTDALKQEDKLISHPLPARAVASLKWGKALGLNGKNVWDVTPCL